MDKTQQAAQLRLAADILETGHPWKWQTSDGEWVKPTIRTELSHVISDGLIIRLALATPPDGRTLHNPGKLTAEQVGVGYRLFCKGENNGQHANQAEMWIGKWVQANDAKGQITTYRVPLSVPWPEAPKPDPYAELREAKAQGKRIQCKLVIGIGWADYDGDFSNADSRYEFRIFEPAFQLPSPPPGMKWHREDGWEEGDLPQGYRPLILDETSPPTDEIKRHYGWTTLNSPCDCPELPAEEDTDHRRTSRPLTFEHAGKTWTWHRPGDPRPCDGESMVHIITRDNDFSEEPSKSKDYEWDQIEGSGRFAEIIGWRYADEKKTVPLGPEDVQFLSLKEVSDLRKLLNFHKHLLD